MNLSISEKIMYSTLQIEMLDNNSAVIGYASGFIFHFCCNSETNSTIPALVTNRHVLGKCSQIKVTFTRADHQGAPNAQQPLTATIRTDQSIFHPRANIDLAILPLAPLINTMALIGQKPFYCALDKSLIPASDIWPAFDAIEEVTMVGYPRGLRDSVNNLPIFRRGITATHPRFDYQGEPMFLVDMACFPGSSGSPVFLLNEGSYYTKSNNAINIGTRVLLLGIQCGVPTLEDIGSLLVVPTGQTSIKPVMPSFINLGIILKSNELLAFEPILQSLTHK